MDLVPPDAEDGAAKAEISLDLARAQLGVGKHSDAVNAIKVAREAARRDGRIQAAACRLAATANDAGLAREAGKAAIDIFLAQMNDNPLSESAHANILQCYQVLLQLKDADLKRDPNNSRAFVEAADLLQSLSDIERRIRLLSARSLLIQALESNPSNVEWSLRTAEIEINLGAFVDAGRRIDAVLDAQPDNSEARRLKTLLTSSAS